MWHIVSSSDSCRSIRNAGKSNGIGVSCREVVLVTVALVRVRLISVVFAAATAVTQLAIALVCTEFKCTRTPLGARGYGYQS